MEEAKDIDIFYKLGRWCLVALAFLFPIWFLPATISPLDFNKALLVSCLVFLSFIFYLLHSIKRSSIKVPVNLLSLLVAVLVIAFFVSALLAGFSASLWGGGISNNGFFDVATFFLLTILIPIYFAEFVSLRKLFLGTIFGFSILMLSVWFFSILGLGKYVGGFFADPAFNTIGSWNSAAFTAGFFLMMLYPFVSFSANGKKIVLAIFAVSALFLVALVNFKAPLIILSFFGFLLLSYVLWRKQMSGAVLAALVFLLAVSVGAIFFNEAISSLLPFQQPLEVGVNHLATLRIASASLKENILLGSGPNSFAYLWDRFKPNDVNLTLFWNTRFPLGSSFLATLFAETGVLGGGVLLIFLGVIWYRLLKIFTLGVSKKNNVLAFSSFLLFSYSILMWFLYAVSYPLIFFGFLAIGLSLAVLSASGQFKIYDLSLFSEGPKGFLTALVMVFLVLLGVGGAYAGASRYFSQVVFASGLNAFNQLNNIDVAEQKFLLALKSYKRNDIYLQTLSELNLVRARFALQDKEAPSEILGSRFKDSLDKGVAFARGAIKAAPQDANHYRTLAKIYELLMPFNADALGLAVSQYDEALKRAPKNPLLWYEKASLYVSDFSANRKDEPLKKAEENLLKSIELKSDYADAHFLLAQVYEAEGKIDEAVKRGESAALINPDNLGSLFQLGLLYYRTNRFSNAETVLERAISINPDYSNARYFLGLIYDRTNRKKKAISEFEKIAELNPDNEEVKNILSNLSEGKSALSGIISLEKRSAPPLDDQSGAVRKKK